MDLIYMSDVMAYQSIRSPIYDRYDQPWDHTKERTSAQHLNRKRAEKEPCKICQEKQRRTLMNYIRSKSHEHTDEKKCISEQIEEEEEEEEEERVAEEQPQHQPAVVQSTNNNDQGQDVNNQTMDSKQRSC